MKQIITKKDKLILAELNPDCSYIMLVNPWKVRMETLRGLEAKVRIQIVLTEDVNQSIRFVEIPVKEAQAE